MNQASGGYSWLSPLRGAPAPDEEAAIGRRLARGGELEATAEKLSAALAGYAVASRESCRAALLASGAADDASSQQVALGAVRGVSLGLYKILLLPILYGV